MGHIGIKHPFLTCMVIASAVVALVNLTFGTYFDHYEASINALIIGEFSGAIDWSFFVPGWFLTFPVLSILSEVTGSPHVYAGCFTLFNTLILAVLMYVVLSRTTRFRKSVRVLLVAALILLSMDSVLQVYSLKLSFFSLIAAVLLYDVRSRMSAGRWQYPVVTMLCVIGITARLEIAVIASGLAVCGIFLFNSRVATRAFTLMLFIISLSTFAFYKVYEARAYPQHATILCAEQAFFDRYSVSYRDFEDREMQLKVHAMGMFIRDDGVYDIGDIASTICGTGIFDYVFSERFPRIYLMKLVGLYEELGNHLWLLALGLALFIAACIMQASRGGKEGQRWVGRTFIMFLLAFVLMPLAINVYASVAYGLIVCLSAVMAFASLLALSRHRVQGGTPILAALVLLLTVLTGRHSMAVQKAEVARSAGQREVRELQLEMMESGKALVLLNTLPYHHFPSMLFSGLHEQRLRYFSADHFLSRYDFFTEYNRSFFGEGYSSLPEKFRIMANDSVAVVATEGWTDFYKEYLSHFHDMEVSFEEVVRDSKGSEISAYRVFIN